MRSFGIPVRNSVAIGIGAGVGQNSVTAQARAVMALFQNVSEYDFTTPSGAYQTSAGPAAVAVNDPIGLELDAMGTVGAELAVVPNTGIGSGTWAVSGGIITRNGSSSGQATADIIGAALLLTTNTYFVTITATGVSGDSFGIKIGTSTAFGPIAADGVYEFRAPGGGTSSIQIIPWGGSAGQATITVSVKQVTGNHATQPTAINRPLLQRGLWNLLAYSQDFSNVNWGKTNCTAPTNSAPDPFGGNTATLVTTTATAFTTMSQGGGGQSATTALTAVLWLRAGTVASLDLALYDGVSFTGGSSQSAAIISGPGAVNQLLGSLYSVSGLSTVDWTQVLVTRTGYGSSNGSFLIYPRNSGSSNAGDTLVFYRAGLFQGTLTADQILQQGGIPLTTSAAGSNPVAGPFWAQFINASALRLDAAAVGVAADDYFVIATFKPDSVATNRTFACPIGNAAGNRLAQLRVNSTGILQAIWNDASAASVVDVVSSNDTLITGTAFKRGANIFLRKNAVQLATGVAPAALASMPGSSIGSNNATGAPELASGNGYHVIWGKGSPTNEQFTAMERYSASKVGLII